MHRFKSALLILSTVSLIQFVHAFDAPPAPEPKTMEWTVEQAQYLYPIFDIHDTKAEWIVEQLNSSMNTPGFYLDIDASEVEDLLGKKMNFKEEKITWLNVLAKVADSIEADIVITPGIFKLVPRTQEAKNKKKTNKPEMATPNQP